MKFHRAVFAELEEPGYADVFWLANGKKGRFHHQLRLRPINLQFRDIQVRPAGLMKRPAAAEHFQTAVFREKTRVHFLQSADALGSRAPENICPRDVSLADVEVQWRLCVDRRLEIRLARKNLGELSGG